jgi:hypothetical protein
MTPSERRAATFDGVTYAPGTRFRAIRAGVTLDGMVPERGGYGGWRQQLQPGDVVTCTGYGPGWGGDPGYGVEFTSTESEAARACHCEIRPMAGGVFDYHPAAGLIEPIDDEARPGRHWNQHSNDIGDYCPHSGKPVPAGYEAGDDDPRCPAACRASMAEDNQES